jgi:hypothetical protein
MNIVTTGKIAPSEAINQECYKTEKKRKTTKVAQIAEVEADRDSLE